MALSRTLGLLLGLALLSPGCDGSGEDSDAPATRRLPDASELPPIAQTRAGAWLISKGVWDEIEVRSSSVKPSPRGVDLDAPPQAPSFDHACYGFDDSTRAAAAQEFMGMCDTRMWCDWIVPKALGATGVERDRLAMQAVGCSGPDAVRLFSKESGLSTATLATRLSFDWTSGPAHAPAEVIRASMGLDRSDSWELGRLSRERSVDTKIWAHEVMQLRRSASLLADRVRTGRAMLGVEGDEAVRLYQASCEGVDYECLGALGPLPDPSSDLTPSMLNQGDAGSQSFLGWITRLKTAHPEVDLVEPLTACALSTDASDPAVGSCVLELYRIEPDAAVRVASKRSRAPGALTLARHRWLRGMARGGPDATLKAMVRVGLVDEGAAPSGAVGSSDPVILMAINGRAQLLSEIDADLASLCGLVGLTPQFIEAGGSQLALTVNNTRYAIDDLKDESVDYGFSAAQIRLRAALVNTVAARAGAPRRLLIQTRVRGEIALVAATPDALTAAVQDGLLDSPSLNAAAARQVLRRANYDYATLPGRF